MTRLVLRSPRVDASRLGALAYGLIVASLIIALLILGREIIEPLVIAGLLAFILQECGRRNGRRTTRGYNPNEPTGLGVQWDGGRPR